MLQHSQQETYYKLITTEIINTHIGQHRAALQKELFELATDDVLLRRRYRMLSQLAQYESQILKKIYQFNSNQISDYCDAVAIAIREINHVTDRSG